MITRQNTFFRIKAGIGITAWILLLIFGSLLFLPGNGLCERKVFKPDETESFSPDANLLTIRVAGMHSGDSMLITMGDESMAVDLGTGSGMEQILEMFRAAGISKLDYFCNTHPHEDHAGGFIPLVQTGFSIGSFITFFDHDYVGPSAPQKLTLRTAEKWNVPVVDKKTEDRMTIGDAEITFYRLPDQKYTWETSCNDFSAMLHIRFGDCAILLTADVEIRSQAVLSRLYDLKADILKAPHHGASRIEQSFLDEVDPEYAFITGGAGDSEDVQKQLEKRGVCHINFSPWGMITMQTDGTKWIVWQDFNPDMDPFIQRYLKSHPWLIV